MPEPSPSRTTDDSTETIYRDHADWLAQTLRRRFGRDMAEDIAQDAWLRLLGGRPPKDIRSPRAYLMRIAANLVIDHRRRAARRPNPDDRIDVERIATLPDQPQAVALRDVVLGLPEPLRDVFVLSRFDGLTYAEIGEHLNISAKTVEWRMSRALALCSERLRD